MIFHLVIRQSYAGVVPVGFSRSLLQGLYRIFRANAIFMSGNIQSFLILLSVILTLSEEQARRRADGACPPRSCLFLRSSLRLPVYSPGLDHCWACSNAGLMR